MSPIILNIASDLSQFSSKIHLPYTRKKIVGSDFYECQKIIKPGMAILSKTDGEFSNWLIPGFWSHVGFVTDKLTVVEATTHGVREVSLYEFFMGKDYIALVEMKVISSEQISIASVFALEQLGKPYDFDFGQTFGESSIKKLYCSELVYEAYKAGNPNMSFTPKEHYGQTTIAPNDYWDSKDFYRVWTSKAYREL